MQLPLGERVVTWAGLGAVSLPLRGCAGEMLVVGVGRPLVRCTQRAHRSCECSGVPYSLNTNSGAMNGYG